MNAMTTRIRMYFDTDEELKLAIQFEALKEDVSASELIERFLRERLAGSSSLSEAKKVVQERKKKPKGG